MVEIENCDRGKVHWSRCGVVEDDKLVVVVVVLEEMRSDFRSLLPFVSVSFTSVLRILAMLLTAIAQQSAATLILDEDSSSTTDHLLLRFQRRAKYKKWLWWSRCTLALTVIQFVCATYLVLNSAYYFSKDTPPTACLLGWIGMEHWLVAPQITHSFHDHRLFRCSRSVLYRLWCSQMEIFLPIPWQCLEIPLQGGFW